ncbi:hypothetical protein NEIMUCOT_04210 [Neisseria mucosa ATCC 25996]|uniref:Uncharacterized protein n=1 Tax=Neisseria mucosa (strain ATCC 25996 / DSM 4631 / NCTC 10774 / M26) TaxID=546266 RepID=D2ZUC2_NEIM2|nr:hypothetical protein NEIMUCOT_04210 [Neisseria mucosa ATCC 25996]
MPRLAVLFVLSAASSPCPDLNLIHYTSSAVLWKRRYLRISQFYLHFLVNREKADCHVARQVV